MGNLKNSLEQQQKINESVKNLFEYLNNEVSYAELIETMAIAQNQIIMLITYYTENMAIHNEVSALNSIDIQNFLFEVSEVYTKLIRPFAKQIGQVYGNQD